MEIKDIFVTDILPEQAMPIYDKDYNIDPFIFSSGQIVTQLRNSKTHRITVPLIKRSELKFSPEEIIVRMIIFATSEKRIMNYSPEVSQSFFDERDLEADVVLSKREMMIIGRKNAIHKSVPDNIFFVLPSPQYLGITVYDESKNSIGFALFNPDVILKCENNDYFHLN